MGSRPRLVAEFPSAHKHVGDQPHAPAQPVGDRLFPPFANSAGHWSILCANTALIVIVRSIDLAEVLTIGSLFQISRLQRGRTAMRILIVGAGSIGGYFRWSAACRRSRCDVSRATSPGRSNLRETGLVIKSPAGDLEWPRPPHRHGRTISRSPSTSFC